MKKTKAKTAANAPEPRVRRPQPVYDGFKDYKAWATEAMEDGGLIRSADRRSQMVGEAWDEYPTEARDQFGIGFKKFTQAKGELLILDVRLRLIVGKALALTRQTPFTSTIP